MCNTNKPQFKILVSEENGGRGNNLSIKTNSGMNLRLSSVLAIITVMCVCCGTSALGYRMPSQQALPDFDTRATQYPPAFTTPEEQAALTRLKSKVAEVRVTADEIIGTPRLITSEEMNLTRSNLTGSTLPTVMAAGATVTDPYLSVKKFIDEYAPLFGEKAEILATTTVKRESKSTKSGLRTTVWEQRLDGVPIYRAVLVANIAENQELITVSSRLVPKLQQTADTSVPNHAQLVAAPPLSAVTAVAVAAGNIDLTLSTNELVLVGFPVGVEKKQFLTANSLRGRACASLIWVPKSRTSLRLCWDVTLAKAADVFSYRVIVDAQTAEVLIRQNLTRFLTDVSYRVFTSDSPTPFSPGCPSPTPCTPPEAVTRSLIVTGALSATASPNGWINDGDNQLSGNNVIASTDVNGDIEPDLPIPVGSAYRVFDFSMDLSQSPDTYRIASAVQLFYWCNWAHDRMYDLGFTEAAGNFQQDNFGNGGIGGDPVLACAQSAHPLFQNNAAMATTPDGQSPTMVMGPFTGPSPDRDSTLDAEIIMHEYNHGVQERLVGGGVGLTYENQPGGLMEGWSDFFALALLAEPSDDPDGTYAPGAYSAYQIDPRLTASYYFGIRRYPYSTDLAKNPLTFKDIDPTQADTHAGIPISPLYEGYDPSDPERGAAEVHNAGEVWCMILWEAHAALVKTNGFVAGNQTMLQLVVDGMKLSPANPTWIEARDAILQADRVNNDGANQSILWAAFSKRGLGVSASAPPSTSNTGIVEATDVPPDLACMPKTVPSTVGGCATRTARFWFMSVSSTNVNCATLRKAIEQNGGKLCLAYLNLPQNYVTDDAVKDATDATLEAMGLYWRKVGFTGEEFGTQSLRVPGSKLCRARKKLSAELVAAIANNVLLGATPAACNSALPTNLIEQAGEIILSDDYLSMKTIKSLLRQFNSSGQVNQLPPGLEECSPYGSVSTLRKISRDPTTYITCPGQNDSCETATAVSFITTNIFAKPVFQDKVNLSKYSNAVGGVREEIGSYATWQISPEVGVNRRRFTVTTENSNFDTLIDVYKGACSSLTLVDSNDDDPAHPPQSKISFTTDGTNTFYLFIGGKSSQSGSLKIKVTSP